MNKPNHTRNLIVVAVSLLLLAGVTRIAVSYVFPTAPVLAKEEAHNHDDHKDGEKHEDHADHEEGEEHADHDDHEAGEKHEDGEEHGDHDEHEEEGQIHLPPERLEELDITLSPVHRGSVKSTLSFPAEVMLDPDGEAHIVPRVAGIAREIFASIGDEVKQGDVLAILDSRELGQAKSAYLGSLAIRDLALTTFNREKRLWEEKISAEQDYLEARQAYRSAEINVESAEQALYALGIEEGYVKKLGKEKNTALTRYEVRAPFDGTVIERHIARGEAIDGDISIFLVADLKTVWAMGRVTERDIRKISVGQEAIVQLEGFPGEEFVGTIDYIGSILDPRSRTVGARVVIDNAEKRIRAGMFGRLAIFLDSHEHDETILVPNNALQRTATGAIVYRAGAADIFEAVAVEVLHASDTFTEVQGPLEENDRVAVGDIFVLKSEAGKAAMGGGHSH